MYHWTVRVSVIVERVSYRKFTRIESKINCIFLVECNASEEIITVSCTDNWESKINVWKQGLNLFYIHNKICRNIWYQDERTNYINRDWWISTLFLNTCKVNSCYWINTILYNSSSSECDDENMKSVYTKVIIYRLQTFFLK